MKKSLVFVPVCLLVLLLINSCALKGKDLGEQTAQGTPINEAAIQPHTDSMQVAAAGGGKEAQGNVVLKSLDGGQTWQHIGQGLPTPAITDNDDGRNECFADDNGLWLSAGKVIYHNQPNATTPVWETIAFPNSQSSFFGAHTSIAPGKAGMFAYRYGEAGIFQQVKGTGQWSPVFTNFTGKRIFSVFETAGGSIFIGSERGLFKSTNNGKSWKQLPIGGGGKIVASNGVLLATCEQGIVRSTDDGESWTVVLSEGGVGIDVATIQDGFAAITYSTAINNRIIRASYDGGKTWPAIHAGLQADGFIRTIPLLANAKNAALTFSDSTRRSKETSVQPATSYLTSIVQVGDNILCGHSYGISRSSNKGKTWESVRCVEPGRMFKLFVSGNVIYAIQVPSHC